MLRFTTRLWMAAALLGGAVGAAAGTLLPAQSEVTFTSRQMGVPVDGRFKRFDAQVAFDPRKPEAAAVSLRIDLGSVALGAAEVETEVAKPVWFNTAAFPQATFRSTAVKAAGPGRYEVRGMLAIKGQQRELAVPVALAQAAGTTTATGSFTLKRLDFKIGDGEWADTSMVANDVVVRFKLSLTGIAPL
jgi:polyisoprenoid-binding protein YceI